MATLADLEYEFLGGFPFFATGTLSDRRAAAYLPDQFSYFSSGSGLVPAQSYSLADHKLKFYRTASGIPDGTLADCQRKTWGG